MATTKTMTKRKRAAPKKARKRAAPRAAPRTTPDDPGKRADVVWLPRRTLAGVVVDEARAMTYSAVWAAVGVISESLAGLPWHVHQRLDGGGSDVVLDTPAANIARRPNPEMTPFTFRETLMAWALSWGNGYAEIERDGMGRPKWLWPISPDRVTPGRDAGNNLAYEVKNDMREPTILPAANMYHLRGLGFDGLRGYSVIAMAARSLSIGIAAENFGGAFFGNGASLGGVLEHPATLDEDGRKALRESWQAAYGGSQNTGKVAVLEEGMKYTSIGIPPDDAQFLETRKFQITDVARWFKIPPHKIGDLERATFSNIEEQNIGYTTDTVVPWARRWEQEADGKVLGRQNQARQFNRLNINGLLRGSIEKRFNAYAVGRQWGFLNADDIRALEDMNPLPDGQGQVYLSPANMLPADQLGQLPAPVTDNETDPDPDPDPDPPPPAARPAGLRRILADAARRCLAREVNRAKRLPKDARSTEGFAASMGRFYLKHREYVLDAFRPAAYTMAEAVLDDVPPTIDVALNLFADNYLADGYNQLCDAWDENNLASFEERASGPWADEIAAALGDNLQQVVLLEQERAAAAAGG